MLLDRAGSRWCLSGAMIGLGGAMLALSTCTGWVSFLACFLTIRTIFRSALEVWCVVPISLWFDKWRGRAMSVFSIGETVLASMAGLPLPPTRPPPALTVGTCHVQGWLRTSGRWTTSAGELCSR